uniref:Uncharacterized protein n=1 Tax=Rhabditophanes sp. KR3021 TaxID=114890 RepID=A0AC35U845_9BILA
MGFRSPFGWFKSNHKKIKNTEKPTTSNEEAETPFDNTESNQLKLSEMLEEIQAENEFLRNEITLSNENYDRINNEYTCFKEYVNNITEEHQRHVLISKKIKQQDDITIAGLNERIIENTELVRQISQDNADKYSFERNNIELNRKIKIKDSYIAELKRIISNMSGSSKANQNKDYVAPLSQINGSTQRRTNSRQPFRLSQISPLSSPIDKMSSVYSYSSSGYEDCQDKTLSASLNKSFNSATPKRSPEMDHGAALRVQRILKETNEASRKVFSMSKALSTVSTNLMDGRNDFHILAGQLDEEFSDSEDENSNISRFSYKLETLARKNFEDLEKTQTYLTTLIRNIHFYTTRPSFNNSSTCSLQ